MINGLFSMIGWLIVRFIYGQEETDMNMMTINGIGLTALIPIVGILIMIFVSDIATKIIGGIISILYFFVLFLIRSKHKKSE